jgi:SAM-dependent methyltransferase
VAIFNKTLDALDIHEFLRGLILPYGEGPAMNYHRVHAGRYAVTLNAMSQAPLTRDMKVLELAAAPYGMTSYLGTHAFPDLTIATFAEPQEERTLDFDVNGNCFSLKEYGFNLERDIWPFSSNTFDLVIGCELVEHLAMDPMALFAEANRILKPGGRLFISTPNAASLQNFVKLASFQPASLAPHFRRPATLARLYERHNREYSAHTLGELFKAAGFEIELMASDSSYPLSNMNLSTEEVEDLLKIIKYPELRRDTLNMIGIKTGPVVDRYPTAHELYLASDA